MAQYSLQVPSVSFNLPGFQPTLKVKLGLAHAGSNPQAHCYTKQKANALLNVNCSFTKTQQGQPFLREQTDTALQFEVKKNQKGRVTTSSCASTFRTTA